MAANTNRYSTYTAASTGSDSKNGDKTEKKDLWNSMLYSVASGKRLPEKNIILLGGTVDSQRDFFESLSNSELRRTLDRNASRIPPVANSFALGYTYYDVLDADQEDTLARISLYTLTSRSPAFASLLQPLLTPQSIPNTLIVVLLDWSQPWKWLRQLREWILLLRTVLVSLSNECKDAMEEVMLSWRDRGRGGGTNLDGTTAAPTADGEVALPLGPGEWEDALGLPLCLVCQNVEHPPAPTPPSLLVAR
jgi:dynein light intermediate chain 1